MSDQPIGIVSEMSACAQRQIDELRHLLGNMPCYNCHVRPVDDDAVARRLSRSCVTCREARKALGTRPRDPVLEKAAAAFTEAITEAERLRNRVGDLRAGLVCLADPARYDRTVTNHAVAVLEQDRDAAIADLNSSAHEMREGAESPDDT